jgi:glycine cleavage system transcriptional repressor
MANYALLSAVGKDKPGIVAAVSAVLFQAGCNIEDSTMARLGGDFAIMLMLRLPEGFTSQQLAERLSPAQHHLQLTIHVADIPPEEVEPQIESARHLILVYGSDKPGIVARLTALLAERNVNITNLRTSVIQRDQPLYVMTIEVELPSFVDQAELTKPLQAVAKELGVQVEIKPKPDARF